MVDSSRPDATDAAFAQLLEAGSPHVRDLALRARP
jgi:hypothetical protein